MSYSKLLHGEWLNKETIEQLCNRDWIIKRANIIYKKKTNVVADVEILIKENPRNVVVKNFGWRNSISRLLSPFMRSRAQKSWDVSLVLLKNGINVPAPITAYTERKHGFIQKNFLLTERIDDYQLARKILRDFTIESRQKEVMIRQRRIMIGEIAKMIAGIHRLKYLHNDLTLGNFLVKNGNFSDIYLIDLNRMKEKKIMTTFRRMYDISKMNLCKCDLEYEHENCLWEIFLNHYDIGDIKSNRISLRKAIQKNKLRKKMKTAKR